MAEFKVEYMEGMQYVDVHLNNETVRAEAGALSYLKGDIAIHSELIPSITGLITSLLADESVYRPTYTGTGIITLESSLGGFHVIELKGESWILERGTYWASEGRVNLSFHRENLMTSIWAGEGLVYLQKLLWAIHVWRAFCSSFRGAWESIAQPRSLLALLDDDAETWWIGLPFSGDVLGLREFHS